MTKMIALNESNYRIGETHQNARFTDHDIELVLSLLDARNDAIETSAAAGMGWGAIARHLNVLQLSYGWIAAKMECSKRHVRDIDSGRMRCQVAAKWKRAGKP